MNDNGVEGTLPDLDFSNDQLFFIGLAMVSKFVKVVKVGFRSNGCQNTLAELDVISADNLLRAFACHAPLWPVS